MLYNHRLISLTKKRKQEITDIFNHIFYFYFVLSLQKKLTYFNFYVFPFLNFLQIFAHWILCCSYQTCVYMFFFHLPPFLNQSLSFFLSFYIYIYIYIYIYSFIWFSFYFSLVFFTSYFSFFSCCFPFQSNIKM